MLRVPSSHILGHFNELVSIVWRKSVCHWSFTWQKNCVILATIRCLPSLPQPNIGEISRLYSRSECATVVVAVLSVTCCFHSYIYLLLRFKRSHRRKCAKPETACESLIKKSIRARYFAKFSATIGLRWLNACRFHVRPVGRECVGPACNYDWAIGSA